MFLLQRVLSLDFQEDIDDEVNWSVSTSSIIVHIVFLLKVATLQTRHQNPSNMFFPNLSTNNFHFTRNTLN